MKKIFDGVLRSTDVTPPSVGIIGAGVGGIAAAVEVRKAGVVDFTLFEQSDGPGGTWRDTRYPGAACDILSHLYSFSFRLKKDWSRTCATRDEILAYIEETVDEFDLRRHCRFGTRVASAVWDDDALAWSVCTESGDEYRFDVLISAVGLLNVPKFPDWPGLDGFRGPQIHTARWDPDLDVTGLRVAVVGTGSSAAQVVPALAPEADHLYVFQREPGWVLPKEDRPFRDQELARFRRNPLAARIERWKIYWRNERNVPFLRPGSATNSRIRSLAVSWLNESVHDEKTRNALLPRYPFGCKRPVADRTFYAAFNRSNVELVPHEVVLVAPDGIVAADGSTRKVDALVFATGFQATDFLCTVDVSGRGGVRLQDTWDKVGGPEAFLGITVAGFPNFFMLYGPNTNSASNSVIFNLECQARYVRSAIRAMMRGGRVAFDVSSRVQDRYNSWLQEGMKGVTWNSGCGNYYHSASGKLVTNWPHSSVLYWLLTRLLRVHVPGLYHTILPRRSDDLKEDHR